MSATSFAVLGPLEARRDGDLLPLGGPKQRTVLAALLLENGRVVSTDRLATLVWGEPPDHAAATLPVYVSHLRKVLRAEGEDPLATRRPGYLIDVPGERLDLAQVRALVERAGAVREQGDRAAAANLLRLALNLWRGPALADLRDVPGVESLVLPLDRQRATIRRELVGLELELGRHLALLPELQAAVADDPYDENLVGLLAIALYRSGLQSEALAAVRDTAARLDAELGLEPGPELRAVEAAVLRQDPALDPGAPLDVDVTSQREDRGVRGARLVLPGGAEVELGARTWVIGRHPSCAVLLADPEASRRHAEIRAVTGGHLLVDLGSTNGTRVGDQEVREHRLADGDRIVVGRSELHYRHPS